MNLNEVFNPLFWRKDNQAFMDGWQFSFDNKNWQAINVPFCPQSKLSGIGYTDFIYECFYKKNFTLKTDKSERVLLHFGAVDYRVNVYVNGKFVGAHVGGYTPFALDITSYLQEGENEVFLAVQDNETACAYGKQSYKPHSFGCFYTRTTGIWQPVWLEFVPQNRVKEFYFYPHVEESSVDLDLITTGVGKYDIKVYLEGKQVGNAQGEIAYRKTIQIPLSEKKTWEVGEGNLYDVSIVYEKDEVSTYFGLREVKYEGYKFLVNGKETYQKLTLDQGFYPDGIYTAPSVEALERDIDICLDLGFNGARLHQKIFDPRFLYLADKKGYMVWGEHASWGVDYSDMNGIGQFLAEWQEAVKRDFNHPSIITWCPLNEVWDSWEDSSKHRDVRTVDAVYQFAKLLDTTRPCVDTSGGHHGHATDLYDFHCYEPLDVVKRCLDEIQNEDKMEVNLLYRKDENLKYPKGTPVNISEYGGIAFGFRGAGGSETETVNEGAVQKEEGWGYGKGEGSGAAFVKRYKELTELIFKYDKVSGFCYTQLYDVEQEQNGLYYYDRTDKLTEEEKEQIRQINALKK